MRMTGGSLRRRARTRVRLATQSAAKPNPGAAVALARRTHRGGRRARRALPKHARAWRRDSRDQVPRSRGVPRVVACQRTPTAAARILEICACVAVARSMAREHAPCPSGQCRWLALLLPGVLALWNLRTFTWRRRSSGTARGSRASSRSAAAAAATRAAHLDPASGRLFYVHATTGEARWTRPAEADGWTTAPRRGYRGFRFREQTGESEYQAETAEGGAAAPGAGGAGATGWAAHVDAESGRTYYFHAASGESRAGTTPRRPDQRPRPPPPPRRPRPPTARRLPTAGSQPRARSRTRRRRRAGSRTATPRERRRVYYYHGPREVRWEHPAAAAAAAAAVTAGRRRRPRPRASASPPALAPPRRPRPRRPRL